MALEPRVVLETPLHLRLFLPRLHPFIDILEEKGIECVTLAWRRLIETQQGWGVAKQLAVCATRILLITRKGVGVPLKGQTL